MDKIIDLDKIFEKEIREYIIKNKGKFSETEWENQIPILYNKFGKTPLDELSGKTPEDFYLSFSGKELVETLKDSINSKVSVSDFLCEAIIKSNDTEKYLITLLDYDMGEEIIMYAMNLLSDKKSVAPLEKYVDFIIDKEISTNIKELAVEILSDNADFVKEKILRVYEESDNVEKEYFIEILSRTKREDRVYNVIIKAFLENKDKTILYSQYVSRYNDERALPYLLERIEKEKLNYEEFRQLKIAIESLGGEYDKKPDFSNDYIFKKVKFSSKK